MPAHAHIADPTQGRVVTFAGDVYRIACSTEDAGGALCIVDARVWPGGGPPPHVHAREDETFHVLEGHVDFHTADGVRRAGPGTIVHLPAGVPHRFTNATDRTARTLFWCTPGGFDRMLLELARPWPTLDTPPDPDLARQDLADPERIARVCARFGVSLLPGL